MVKLLLVTHYNYEVEQALDDLEIAYDESSGDDPNSLRAQVGHYLYMLEAPSDLAGFIEDLHSELSDSADVSEQYIDDHQELSTNGFLWRLEIWI